MAATSLAELGQQAKPVHVVLEESRGFSAARVAKTLGVNALYIFCKFNFHVKIGTKSCSRIGPGLTNTIWWDSRFLDFGFAHPGEHWTAKGGQSAYRVRS